MPSTRTSKIDNLSFIPSGVLPQDSQGILNSEPMTQLIEKVKSQYDLIFFDSPPILGVSDGSVIASEMDMTIMVVQHRRFPRAMLLRVKQAVEQVGGGPRGRGPQQCRYPPGRRLRLLQRLPGLLRRPPPRHPGHSRSLSAPQPPRRRSRPAKQWRRQRLLITCLLITFPASLMKLLLLLLSLFALLAPSTYAQAVMRNGDVFELRLSGMPAEAATEFMLQYTVADDGRVKIPYIGEMQAGGISTTELARSIERKLVAAKIFTNPTAVISLQAQSRFVTIGGEVRAPGVVPWTPDLTVSSALKRVGGLGEWGKDTKIKITREGKSWMVNLRKKDKDPNQNPKLLPGDEVEFL